MDPLLLLVVSIFLAVLLASAAVHKIAHRSAFRHAMIGYRLLPVSWVPAVGWTLSMLELVAAAMLLWEPTRPAGAGAAAILFCLYAGAMLVNLLRGRNDLSCGCGWGVDPGRSEPRISATLVGRNLLLIGAALMVAAVHADRPQNAIDILNGTFGGVFLVLLWLTGGRLSANQKLMSLWRAS